MLVVKVEIWPFGQKEHAREIGRTYIWNVGGDQWNGSYSVAVCDPDMDYDIQHPAGPFGPRRHWLKKGSVLTFPRGPKNIWPLVLAALKSCKVRKVKSEGISHGAERTPEDPQDGGKGPRRRGSKGS